MLNVWTLFDCREKEFPGPLREIFVHEKDPIGLRWVGSERGRHGELLLLTIFVKSFYTVSTDALNSA